MEASADICPTAQKISAPSRLCVKPRTNARRPLPIVSASALIVVITLIVAACSKEHKPKETQKGKPEDYAALAATYVLEPSSTRERVILRADKGVQYIDNGREVLGRFVLDEKSMRIYLEKDEGRVTGIFLYGSYDKSAFRGKWDGEIRTLRRADSGGTGTP